jgi:hypothetical protein
VPALFCHSSEKYSLTEAGLDNEKLKLGITGWTPHNLQTSSVIVNKIAGFMHRRTPWSACEARGKLCKKVLQGNPAMQSDVRKAFGLPVSSGLNFGLRPVFGAQPRLFMTLDIRRHSRIALTLTFRAKPRGKRKHE